MNKTQLFLKTSLLFYSFSFLCFIALARAEQPSHAEILFDKASKSYSLIVDGQKFFIKGIGVGEAVDPEKGTDYLLLAKDAGANTVRTWGERQGTREYFDRAQKYGLKVDAGIWLNYPTPKISYLDMVYKISRKKEILEYVRKFKDHPAILFWNVGNEVFAFTQSEDERVAFARFLEELCEAIHKEDPNHPIVYASAEDMAFRYIVQYVPSLDVIGINSYNPLPLVPNKWKAADLGIPFIFTEYGPPGHWEQGKGPNGKPSEISDTAKAKYYTRAIKTMDQNAGECLGGFAFHLGRCPQTSLTWYSLNYYGDRTASFTAVKEGYEGKAVANKPPVVEKLVLSKTQRILKKEMLTLVYAARDPESDPLEVFFRMGESNDDQIYVNKDWGLLVKKDGESQYSFEAPSKEGVYRVYIFVRDGRGNVASANKTIRVV